MLKISTLTQRMLVAFTALALILIALPSLMSKADSPLQSNTATPQAGQRQGVWLNIDDDTGAFANFGSSLPAELLATNEQQALFEVKISTRTQSIKTCQFGSRKVDLMRVDVFVTLYRIDAGKRTELDGKYFNGPSALCPDAPPAEGVTVIYSAPTVRDWVIAAVRVGLITPTPSPTSVPTLTPSVTPTVTPTPTGQWAVDFKFVNKSRFSLDYPASDYIPAGWISRDQATTRFVVEMTVNDGAVNTCRYAPLGNETAVHLAIIVNLKITVIIKDLAGESKVIGTDDFYRNTFDPCPFSMSFKLGETEKSVLGDKPSTKEISEWIAKVIQPNLSK